MLLYSCTSPGFSLAVARFGTELSKNVRLMSRLPFVPINRTANPLPKSSCFITIPLSYTIVNVLTSFPSGGKNFTGAVEKLAAVATALLVIGLFIGLLALAGAVLLRIALGTNRALLFGLNVSLFAMVFAALAFLVSQFTRERRPAAGITGVLLGGSRSFSPARAASSRVASGWDASRRSTTSS